MTAAGRRRARAAVLTLAALCVVGGGLWGGAGTVAQGAPGDPALPVALVFPKGAPQVVTVTGSTARGLAQATGPSAATAGPARSVSSVPPGCELTVRPRLTPSAAVAAAMAWAAGPMASAAGSTAQASGAWFAELGDGAARPLTALALGPGPLLAVPATPQAAPQGEGSGVGVAAPVADALRLGGTWVTLVPAGAGDATPPDGRVFSADGAAVAGFSSLTAAVAVAGEIEAAGMPAFVAPATADGATAGYDVRVLGAVPADTAASPPGGVAQATALWLTRTFPALAGRVQPVVAGDRTVLLLTADGTGFLAPGFALTTSCSLTVQGDDGAPAGGVGPYAGAIAVTRAAPHAPLTVVNAVPLETYVAGVVPLEMPADWPAAALGAQAIASRTYALYALDAMEATAGVRLFALNDTAGDQMYGGLGVETAPTNAAVWATWGEIVVYQGMPIEALYEADSGGATASSVHVWGMPLPYLTHVVEPPGYVPPYRWTVRLGVGALAQDVRRAAGIDVGRVVALHTLARGRSGRVVALLVVGTRGRATLTDDTVRTGLGLLSSLFRLRSDSAVRLQGVAAARTPEGLDGLWAVGAQGAVRIGVAGTVSLRGADTVCEIPAAPTAFVLRGAGDGPGLGMTQYGALLLARRGATPEQIVRYYYPGTTVAFVPASEGDEAQGG